MVNELIRMSLAKSTFTSYSRIWDQFQTFVLEQLNLPLVMPFSVDIVAKYLAFLYMKQYSASTLMTVASVVAFAHKIRDLQSPTESFLIRKLLAGVRMLRKRGDKRHPINLVLLLRLLNVIPQTMMSRWDKIMMRALMRHGN